MPMLNAMRASPDGYFFVATIDSRPVAGTNSLRAASPSVKGLGRWRDGGRGKGGSLSPERFLPPFLRFSISVTS
jgi:hypothetical protein